MKEFFLSNPFGLSVLTILSIALILSRVFIERPNQILFRFIGVCAANLGIVVCLAVYDPYNVEHIKSLFFYFCLVVTYCIYHVYLSKIKNLSWGDLIALFIEGSFVFFVTKLILRYIRPVHGYVYDIVPVIVIISVVLLHKNIKMRLQNVMQVITSNSQSIKLLYFAFCVVIIALMGFVGFLNYNINSAILFLILGFGLSGPLLIMVFRIHFAEKYLSTLLKKSFLSKRFLRHKHQIAVFVLSFIYVVTLVYTLNATKSTRYLFNIIIKSGVLGGFIGIMLFITIAYISFNALDAGCDYLLRNSKSQAARRRAIVTVCHRAGHVAIIGIGCFMLLSLLNMHITPIMTFLGVVGLVLGPGWQTVVKDFVNGAFVLWEDNFDIGDTIQIGSFMGQVEDIKLRSIKVRVRDGSINVIPFRMVENLVNLSRGITRVSLDFPLFMHVDFKQAHSLILETIKNFWAVYEQPQSLIEYGITGIKDITRSQIVFGAWIITTSDPYKLIMRELYDRIASRLLEEKMLIPVTEVT